MDPNVVNIATSVFSIIEPPIEAVGNSFHQTSSSQNKNLLPVSSNSSSTSAAVNVVSSVVPAVNASNQ